MAFPVVVSVAATAGSSGTTLPLTMPSGIGANDLLIAIVGADTDSGATMSGWTKVSYGSNGTQGATVWVTTATGSGDSGTVSGASKVRFAYTYCVEGWTGTLSDVVVAHGTTNTLDPPTVNMTSSADHLYIVALRNNNSITGAPSGYGNLLTQTYLSVAYLGTARKTATSSSDNPGVWTAGAASGAHVLTIGVRPGSAGLVVDHAAATTMSAAASLTVAGVPNRPATVTMAAESTLTTAGTPTRFGALALSASATLATAATRIAPGAVAMPADSTLTSAGTLPGPSATLPASGTLTVGGTANHAATAALDATSALTVAGAASTSGAVALAGVSSLTVAGVSVRMATIALPAAASLTTGAQVARVGAFTWAAAASLTTLGTTPGVAELRAFDPQVLITPPNGYLEPLPLTLGPNWQPNDIRILFVSAAATASNVAQMIQMNPDPPTGFTAAYALNPGNETQGVYYRRLQAGDTDTSVAWVKPPGWQRFNWTLITIRGVDPNVDPVAGPLSMAHTVGDAFCTADSISVPAKGAMLFSLGTSPDPEGTWPSWATSIGIPTDWKHVAATDKSGDTFYSYDTSPALSLVSRYFAGVGSTGTVTYPIAQGAPSMSAQYVFLRPAPDVSTTIGMVSETDTASAITSTPTTLVSSSITPAEPEVDSAGQVFTGLGGTRISDPLALSGNPVTASRIEWTLVAGAAGSTCTIETSINNGASWDTPTNGGPIPRLAPEDTATKSVLTRVVMTRLDPADASPELEYLRVAVTDDASTVEMVHVAHGIVDKVNVKTTAGDGGSGSSGGPGVTAKGGGQAGGGTSLRIHAVDLSKAVSRNVWSSPYVIPTGTNYAVAARALLLNRLPNHTAFSLCTTTRVTTEPLIYGLAQGSDPWQDLQEMLLPAQLECFFDAAGVFVLREIPDPTVGVPVWTIDDDAHPVITSLDRQLTGEQTFNYITVKGEGTSTANPVSAVAFDDDPLSATYVLGDYGVVSVTITLPGLVTIAQAQTAANAILRGSLGGAEVVTIHMVPNPALEPGDLVVLDVEDAKVSGTYLVNGLSWSPSQASPMQLICFKQIPRS